MAATLTTTAQALRPVLGLVLMGGGARTAYQIGVLQTVAQLLAVRQPGLTRFPFQVLVGTSAGALNAAFLAAAATEGLGAFDALAAFWQQLRSGHVYELSLPKWARLTRLGAAASLLRQARGRGAILDTMRLVDTLHRNIPLDGIHASLVVGAIDALAVTASSYCTGVHWTFVQAGEAKGSGIWSRPGRRAVLQDLSIEHLMASSAIPFLFPSTPLWVDEGHEYFGDGSMRQTAPLSPAIHLGADRILVIGVGQPQRAGIGEMPRGKQPTFGGIVGHTLATVFHDTLAADVEQAHRFNRALRLLPHEARSHFPYRHVDVLAFHPSTSLDEVGRRCLHELPRLVHHALGGTAALQASGAIPSYLLFEPCYVRALMDLGVRDALVRKDELMTFFSPRVIA